MKKKKFHKRRNPFWRVLLLVLCLSTKSVVVDAFVLPQQSSITTTTFQKSRGCSSKQRTTLPTTTTTTTTSKAQPPKLGLSLEDSWIDASGRLDTIQLPTKFLPSHYFEATTSTSIDEPWLTLATFATQVTQAYNDWELGPLGLLLLVTTPLLTILLTTLYRLSFPPTDYRSGMEPYPRGQYDPIQAKAYYSKHPKVVWQRGLQILRLSNKFLTRLFLDKYVFRREEAMRPQRAQELLALITQLGPTAIKVGQALSVRPDLIATEYSQALSTLQDQVPPFSNADAKKLLLKELGPSKLEELQGVATSNPVASASIGQVYKATTVDGQEVAVKVQRPNVLSDIALDLYIVREFAPFYQKYIAKSQTDLRYLANEWGRGFIAELDYRQEADKTAQFNKEMAKRNLDAVTAPVVLNEYSTEQILVTEWIDGVRIDRSDEEDIPRLCSVALNAYLVMLLELQSLHCDPHPGNLLRTKDGRLCILDFGMTLDVDPTLQYSLLEYIAHCTSDNYEKVPEDLVNMGFLKPERLEYAKRSGVLEPLVYFLRQAGKGGGADKVRDRVLADFRERYPGADDKEIRKLARQAQKERMEEAARKESVATGITTEVEELQKRNRDSFAIPEWFVYTSRAFITLEGVSLQADENYSLIQSCFPYIAKRLVKDDSPRAQKALKELLYGAGDVVDVSRLGELADGFSTYTTTTKTLNTIDDEGIPALEEQEQGSANKSTRAKLVEAEAAITLAKDSADVLLDPKGNLVQNLLLEEGALAASANVKDQIRGTLVDGPQQFRDSLPLGVGDFLPKLPFENMVAPFVKKTETEVKAQQLVEKLSQLVQNANNVGLGSGRAVNALSTPASNQDDNSEGINELLGDLEPEQAALIVKELRENLPEYTGLVGQLGTKFIGTLLDKASKNIDMTLADLSEKEETDQVLMTAARGLSSAAQQGARTIQRQQTDEVLK